LEELVETPPRSKGKGQDQATKAPGTRLDCASFGKMRERSAGKDTTTGHWEIAGAIMEEPFATWARFPDALVRQIEREAGVEFLGNYASSGTVILDELGPEHLRTKKPILYTSADSVLQIAAHEEIIPVERLYEICRIARRLADPYRIGRVIARPFLGSPGSFQRTARRHDFSIAPPRTILNALQRSGVSVVSVGKIFDIFAGEGITVSLPTANNREGMAKIDQCWPTTGDWLLFANLVDFDSVFGHRRDVRGYARALQEFDQWLGGFLEKISPNDLIIITADHGNDPTFAGTDHTREEVPLFVLEREKGRKLGTRETFADVAASIAEWFELEAWPVGESFLARS
jgi:phosphopentomutase